MSGENSTHFYFDFFKIQFQNSYNKKMDFDFSRFQILDFANFRFYGF